MNVAIWDFFDTIFIDPIFGTDDEDKSASEDIRFRVNLMCTAQSE